MSTTTVKAAPAVGARSDHLTGGRRRANIPGGIAAWIWLAIIILPIYYVVITSLKSQSGFYEENALLPPASPTLENYSMVIESGFFRYLLNSAIVTVGTVVPAVLFAFMAAYAIVRGHGRFAGATNTVFVLGLALPLQATIVPIFVIVSRLGFYDTLWAIILPSIAFALPISVLILSTFLRNIPSELFQAMRMDGASTWSILWKLVLPLTRPAIVTVSIYNALQVWNGFLFPLVLTQSPSTRVLPLSLWSFQGEFSVNVPAILAAVVLSTLPLLVLYIVGRRQLLAGLTAGFGK